MGATAIHRAISWVALAGCYSPTRVTECAVSCADGACPNGFSCGGVDQLCHLDGHDECYLQGLGGDAAVSCYGLNGTGAFGPGLFRACISNPPGFLSLASFDTGECPKTPGAPGFLVAPQPTGGPDMCIRFADSIAVDSAVQITGPRPLVLVATQDIRISGVLSVASRVDGTTGAGTNWAGCPVAGAGDPSSTGGGGGGAGGGFQAKGNVGGSGNGAQGGLAISTAPLGFVHGGCAGGKGGAGLALSNGAPGNGGGAVYLIAGGQIVIDGAVIANGASGSFCAHYQGGHGGGSGGLVALDAPVVRLNASGRVGATGGAGTSGGDNMNDGQQGTDSVTTEVAAGHDGQNGGGKGGNGSLNNDPPTAEFGVAGTGAGGGGGGGAGGGYVVVYSPDYATADPLNTSPPVKQ